MTPSDLIAGFRLRVVGLVGDALHELRPGQMGAWAWAPPVANGRAPDLILLVDEPTADSTRHRRLVDSASGLWPFRPVRRVSLERFDTDPNGLVALLTAHPIVYDLLPGGWLIPEKHENDPLYPAEVNGWAEAAPFAARWLRLAEVRCTEPEGPDAPAEWEYLSWLKRTKVLVRLRHEQPATFADRIVLKLTEQVGDPARACHVRFEQFEAL